MTIEHPEDDVTQLAQRVEKARGRLAYQFDPALTEALSEDELHAERELAERIRGQERGQRWKQAQASASAADRARQTTEEIEKADIRDLLVARKAIAAQRRESSPHAKLASLYRHRSWSLRALAGVVGAGMLWSAVNVQHNIAPGGPGDPLYWFSYLLEGMISVCLIIIMIGTNKVAEWGVVDNRRQVAVAEFCLLALTVALNTYPYMRDRLWYDAAVHAIAPVMIGVALLIHNAASGRFGLAISRATDQVRDMPDPAEQIRRTVNSASSYRVRVPSEVRIPPQDTQDAEITELAPVQALEAGSEDSQAQDSGATSKRSAKAEGSDGAASSKSDSVAAEKKTAAAQKSAAAGTSASRSGSTPKRVPEAEAKATAKPAASKNAEAAAKPAKSSAASKSAGPQRTEKPAAPTKPVPKAAAPEPAARPAASTSSASSSSASSSNGPARPAEPKKPEPSSRPAAATPASGSSPSKAVVKPAATRFEEQPAARQPTPTSPRIDASAAADIWTAKPVERPSTPPSKRQAAADAKRAAEAKKAEAKRLGTDSASAPSDLYDTGQLRIAEILEQELAELQAQRRKARTSRQRLSQQSGRDR
ncbi:hypothetical protein [Nocardia callitridis]|uniref:DUF2637 domain-containing protein n=1 Tax=Nocardia callitridis TaxID=648753 RepID=A0ABP9KR87_9NOCA